MSCQLINTYSDDKRGFKKFIFSPNNLWSVEEFKAHLEKRNKSMKTKTKIKIKLNINFNLDFKKSKWCWIIFKWYKINQEYPWYNSYR